MAEHPPDFEVELVDWLRPDVVAAPPFLGADSDVWGMLE
jgi:hypothetical protein